MGRHGSMKIEVERRSLQHRPRTALRLFLAMVFVTGLLNGSVWLLASSGAAAMHEEPTWHGFLPQGEVTNSPVIASVDLTTNDVPPLQGTGVYSISFDLGAIWIGPILVQSLSDLGENEWRFETRTIPFPNGDNNRVRFGVQLEDKRHIVSPSYQVTVSRKRFLPVVLRGFPATWARYEPNDTIATAYGPLTSNQIYEAYIWPVGDQDYYFIDVTSTAAKITVSLTNIPTDADYDLYLYNSTPSLVASSAHYGSVDEFIEYQPTATGRYIIRIYPYQGANKDQPYRLRAVFR
jgi:hypothetical protein